jgi:putative AlgH/UPF0301 family transcriptional regulator
MHDYTKVHTVNNILEARDIITNFQREGYVKENIFVLTHDKKRTEHVIDHTDSNKIGVAEEGILTAVANLFRSAGDELQAKLTAVGVSSAHADQLEKEMDKGKIVILAWSGTTYDDKNPDPNVSYTGFDSNPLM